MDSETKDILTEIKGELQSISYFLRRPVVTFQFGLSYKRNWFGKIRKDTTIFTFDIKNQGKHTIEAHCNIFMGDEISGNMVHLLKSTCFYTGVGIFPVQAGGNGHGYIKYRELNDLFITKALRGDQIQMEIEFWWESRDGQFDSEPELFRYRFDPKRWKLIYDY